MRNSWIFKTSLQIFFLAVFFVGLFHIWAFVLDRLWTEKQIEKNIQTQNESNATRFQSAYSSQFGVIGVALSTRIGMMYSELWERSQGQSRFYSGISTMPKNASERRRLRQKLLEENMLFMREYYNLSQTDIIDALKNSSDRARTLDNFVNQIELRREGATQSLQNLQTQRKMYINEIQSISQAANSERNTLEREFNKWGASESLASSDRFISLRSLETELLMDIVFINQFIRQYEFLNDYNAWIINALKANRQQIIDRSFVVIPNSGSEFLRPLELIFDEGEISR